ncbi:hypothetical protein HYU09_03220 [Candidatus Woesearchaeota archaeon]|nr:hypothetical protein [Candidatus Woesearchaeota archaeon]
MIRPRHKKGMEWTTNVIFWIFYIMAVGVTAAVIASMQLYFVNENAGIPEGFEESTLIARITSSGECFAYKDKAGKIHAGTIDFERFTQEQMDKCFPESRVKYSFYAALEVPDAESSANSVKTRNWVESPQFRESVEDVLVLKDSSIYQAKLRVKIKNA